MRMFDGWQLGLIDDAGYNGIRDDHIERVAREIENMGVSYVDNAVFNRACMNCCIDSENFTQADIDRLERRLKR